MKLFALTARIFVEYNYWSWEDKLITYSGPKFIDIKWRFRIGTGKIFILIVKIMKY